MFAASVNLSIRLWLGSPGAQTAIPNGQIMTTSEPRPAASEVSTRSGSGLPASPGSLERPRRCRLIPTIATIGMTNAYWNFTSSASTAPTAESSVLPRASQ